MKKSEQKIKKSKGRPAGVKKKPEDSIKISDTQKIINAARDGHSNHVIAKIMGVSHDTIQRQFGDVIDEARRDWHGEVHGIARQMIREKNTQMVIFYMKTRMGYAEINAEKIEETMKNASSIDLSRLSYEELKQFKRLVKKAEGDGPIDRNGADEEVSD